MGRERCSGPSGHLLLPAPATWVLLEVVLMWVSGRCQVGAGQGAEVEDIPQGIAASGGRVAGGSDSPGERGNPFPPLWVPVTGKGAYWGSYCLCASSLPCFSASSLSLPPILLPSKVSLPSLALSFPSPPISFFSFPPFLPIPSVSPPTVPPHLPSGSLSLTGPHSELPILPSWSRRSSHPLQGASS